MSGVSLRLGWLAPAAFLLVPGQAQAQAPVQAQAQAQAQGLPIATPQEIVAGTKSCAAATGAAGVDAARLKADGWRPATLSENGKPITNAGLILGRGHLIARVSGNPAKVCIVIARIQSNAVFAQAVNAMTPGLGVPGKSRPNEANTAYWFPQGHIVQMKLTGKPEAPAVRVAVGSTEKK